MTVASTISIKLDAQTAELRRGFQQSVAATNRLESSLKKSLGAGILKFNAALQVTEKALNYVRVALDSVMQTVERQAALQDFADRINVSVVELQKLRFVTEQFGGSAEVLNTALQRMQRRAADAARSGGALADRMRSLGINVQMFARMAPDQQFLRFADAVKELNTAGEQTALVMALMDTEGVALVDTLRQGSQSLDEFMEKVRVASESNMRAAQDAAAAVSALRSEWEQLKAQSLVSFAPGLEWLAERSSAVLRGWENIGRSIGEIMYGPGDMSEPLRPLAEIADSLGTDFSKWEKYMADFRAEAVKTTTEIAKITATLPTLPKTGAVTSTRASGFSALQEGRQRAQQRARWESRVEGILSAIEDHTRETLEAMDFVPVSIL